MAAIQQYESMNDSLTDSFDQLEYVIGKLSKAWQDLSTNTPGPTREVLRHLITELESKKANIHNRKPRIWGNQSYQSVVSLTQRAARFVCHIRSLTESVDPGSRKSHSTSNTTAQCPEAINNPGYMKEIYNAVFSGWDTMLRNFDEVYPVRPSTDNHNPCQTSSHRPPEEPINIFPHHRQPQPVRPPQTTYYFPWHMSTLYTNNFLL
ncbi:hypothetical protein F4814DRAFT_455393 [Daldinia grandis]|nr:hypothetical protein F4814DRAFT_455393 [Daldinia grandis]